MQQSCSYRSGWAARSEGCYPVSGSQRAMGEYHRGARKPSAVRGRPPGPRWRTSLGDLVTSQSVAKATRAALDPESAAVPEGELGPQRDTLAMIASENCVPRAG